MKRAHKRLLLLLSGAGGASVTPIPANARAVLLGNSWYANGNQRKFDNWLRDRFYVPPTGNLGVAGDRYEFFQSVNPGYFSRVGNAMAHKPDVIIIANAINNIEADQAAAGVGGINANLDAVLAAIAAHANFSNVKRIFLTTTAPYWKLTSARDAARIAHNTYQRGLAAANPQLYAIIDDDLNAGLGFGDYSDQYHINANGGYKVGTTGRTQINAKFDGVSAYPPYGTSGTVNIQSISLASTYMRITTQTAHNLTFGMPIRLTSVTSTFSPGISNAKFTVGTVIDSTTFELYGILSSDYTGSHTAGTGVVTAGLAGVIGTNWASTSNASGATLTTAKETDGNGVDWITSTISGTASAESAIGHTFGSTSKLRGGVTSDGFMKIKITNAAGNGPPVGLKSVNAVMGSATFLGNTIDAWTIVPQSGGLTAGHTMTFDFYNANTVAPNTPVTTMLTDGAGYDAGQYRIASVVVTVPGSPTTTTTATAIKDAINDSVTYPALNAAGITATSSGATVTVAQTGSGRYGVIILPTYSGSSVTSIGHNPYPFTTKVDETIVRFMAKINTSQAATTVTNTFSIIPEVGPSLDIKIWSRDHLFVESEVTAYTTPFNQVISAVNVQPSATLSTSTATATMGPFNGGFPLQSNGAPNITHEWFKANSATVTVTIASPGVFTKTSHGYVANQPVSITTTGALPTGLTASTTSLLTMYYVSATGLATDTFQVSATPGGAVINTSGSQSGTHTIWPWVTTSVLTNPGDLSAFAGSGASVIDKQTATNSFGSDFLWTTKSTGVL